MQVQSTNVPTANETVDEKQTTSIQQKFIAKIRQSRKLQIAIIIIFVLFLTLLITALATGQFRGVKNEPLPTLTPEPSQAPSPTATEDEQETSPTTSPNPPAASPSPTSDRVANPPLFKITYPTEAQNIEMGQNQDFCVTDIPDGGDQTGIKRRHNLNNLGWTQYSDIFTLCFEPREGLNRFSLQYKNKFNEESQQYTVQFNFHRVKNIDVVISGQVFEDINCNGLKEDPETEIKANINLRFLKMPEGTLSTNLTTGVAGAFSYSQSIAITDTLQIKILPDNSSSYQINPKFDYPTYNLGKNSPSIQTNIPVVPIGSLGNCN